MIDDIIKIIAISSEEVDAKDRIDLMGHMVTKVVSIVRAIKEAEKSSDLSVRIVATETLEKIKGYVDGNYTDKQMARDMVESLLTRIMSKMDEDDES